MSITRVVLPTHPAPISHYAHVTRAGPLVCVSGVAGAMDDGTIPVDVADQCSVALSHIEECLEAVGAKVSDIVRIVVYLTNVNDRRAVNPLRIAWFGEHRPASTLVQVAALAHPDLKIEIEVMAYVE